VISFVAMHSVHNDESNDNDNDEVVRNDYGGGDRDEVDDRDD
jgi:hypothetical protein